LGGGAIARNDAHDLGWAAAEVRDCLLLHVRLVALRAASGRWMEMLQLFESFHGFCLPDQRVTDAAGIEC
jgi:hypothetical protein